MFSIFRKKYFLIDLLEGLTDMHCHILPAIDDGAKDGETALEMLMEYKKLGYIGAIATPHMMEDYYDNSSQKIENTYREFKDFKNKNGFEDFKIEFAAEYMLDSKFSKYIDQKDLLPVTNKEVLVEMSYFQKPIQVEEQLFNLQQAGYIPILAHPERYSYLRKTEDILDFKKKGCSLQLNMLSLGKHYGPEAYKHAINLLEGNHFDYLGTDAHKPQHFQVLKEISFNKKVLPNIQALIDRTKEKLTS